MKLILLLIGLFGFVSCSRDTMVMMNSSDNDRVMHYYLMGRLDEKKNYFRPEFMKISNQETVFEFLDACGKSKEEISWMKEEYLSLQIRVAKSELEGQKKDGGK